MEPLHHPVSRRIGADLADKEDVVPLGHGLLLQHGGELQRDPGRVANIQTPGLLQNSCSDLLVLRLAGDAPVGVALLGDDGDGAGAGCPVTGGRRVHGACNGINSFGQLLGRISCQSLGLSLVDYNVVFTLLYHPSHTNLLYMSENSQRMKFPPH